MNPPKQHRAAGPNSSDGLLVERAPAGRETGRRVGHARSVLAILALALGALGLCATFGAPAVAQSGFDSPKFGQVNDVFQGIDFGNLNTANQEPVTWSAKYQTDGTQGRVQITAVVGPNWHIYSTTQPAGGPLATEFTLVSPDSVSITSAFTPDEAPEKSVSDVYPGVTIEEHDGTVIWSAPLKLPEGFKDAIKIKAEALVCQNGGSCMPSKETLTAKFDGKLAAAKSTAPVAPAKTDATPSAEQLLSGPGAKPATFRDGPYEVTWTAGVSTSIAAGEQGQLIFHAKPEAEFHVYHGVVDDSESATNFVITDKSGLLVGTPRADQPVISKSLFPAIPGVPEMPPVQYHKGPVAWSVPIKVPSDTAAGDYKLQGVVCYQACTDKSCLQPKAISFVATVTVADKTDLTLQPIEIKTTKFSAAIDLAAETDWVDNLNLAGAAGGDDSPAVVEKTSAESAGPPATTSDDEQAAPVTAAPDPASGSRASLPLILLMALGGGLILNLMPCVLPVVGLKIMSFVQQAGEDRKRVFALNFAYVAGILAVFAGLTCLAVFASFGWGQQLAYFPVRLGLTVMIFALALSYLGVWELPTPGVATGQSSQDLQEQEGLTGAFFTGAFATILATPCSGPLLGVVLGYTIYLQPIETAAVLMTVGLGMSLPYIFLGLFPSAVGFLPKPGNWMVTLKEFLAFLFLGTVAFFFNQFSDGEKLPVFVTLIGVWFGCWIIGKVPPWETIQKRLRGWTLGIASAAAIGWLAFAYLTTAPAPSPSSDGIEYIVDDHIRWEKYDEERLQELHAAGKTVMLDFTAAWCMNCIVNTHVALDTEATSKKLKELDGVAMLADLTNQPEHILQKLQGELGSKSIPMLAIYPGKTPSKPIVLRDLVSQSMVLNALHEAGPSVGLSGSAASDASAERLTSTTTRSADPPASRNH
ncbi:thioredoxin family protein [Stieleria sp. TO1_6]|uniref:protein-disulfide reductase DsbD family protein n=1 Tax=Stieleria tagensis TaxID=2956795 RepID=UPI00209B1D55|nr:cytochrome c biogenesis protein CcdA [Stieleria tagensis]MCO8121877.1 thioredoxin family protein [Stieleria tagensis]